MFGARKKFMKSALKTHLANTLAEVAIVFVIIGLIATLTTGFTQKKMEYKDKFMFYASINNLRRAVGEVIASSDDNTLPETQTTFCYALTDVFNTISETCSNTSATGTPPSDNDFSDEKIHFTTANGQNFSISPLKEYTGCPQTGTPATCKDPNYLYYIVYVDTDGSSKRKTFIDDDVIYFHVSRSGVVTPYNTKLAGDRNYLSATIYYINSVCTSQTTTTNPTTGAQTTTCDAYRDEVRVLPDFDNVSYRTAVCTANQTIVFRNPYCGTGTNKINFNNQCLNNNCFIELNKPGYKMMRKH